MSDALSGNGWSEDGYLLLRGLLDRETVLNAAMSSCSTCKSPGQALQPDTPLLQGVMPRGGKSVQMMGRKGIAHHPAVLATVEHPALFALFEASLRRARADLHLQVAAWSWQRRIYMALTYDFVYMGRGSPNLYTVWIPFDDIEITRGTLAICRGSHNLESFARIRDTYGKMDVDRDRIEGWFERDPLKIVERFGGQWLGSELSRRRCHHLRHAHHARFHDQPQQPLPPQLRCPLSTRGDPVDERWKRGRTRALRRPGDRNSRYGFGARRMGHLAASYFSTCLQGRNHADLRNELDAGRRIP